MSTITLEFDHKNPIAKKTLDFVLSLGVFKEKEIPMRYNAETQKGISDAKKGKTTPISLEDFRKQLYSSDV